MSKKESEKIKVVVPKHVHISGDTDEILRRRFKKDQITEIHPVELMKIIKKLPDPVLVYYNTRSIQDVLVIDNPHEV